jgi:hypothetical protein
MAPVAACLGFAASIAVASRPWQSPGITAELQPIHAAFRRFVADTGYVTIALCGQIHADADVALPGSLQDQQGGGDVLGGHTHGLVQRDLVG